MKAIHDKSLASIAVVILTLWEIGSSAKRDLTANQVIVFRAMWELSGGQPVLMEDEILKRANQDLESQHSTPLTENDLRTILGVLADLKCIREAATPGNWAVVEHIEYEYR